MCFGSDSTDRSGETEISYFVLNLEAIIFGDFLQQNILWFDIPVNEILFMDALESFHDFDHNFECMIEGKGFAR